MAEIAANPRLVIFAQRKDLSNMLKAMLDQLGRCQKALNELLEVTFILSLSLHSSVPFSSGKTFNIPTFLFYW
jgi:hypothetical protein